MSADIFRRYIDIIEEAAAKQQPWGETPPAPDVTGMQPGQDRGLGDGSRVRLKSDGTIEYSGHWGTHRYNSAGQHIGYTSPSFSGHQISFDADGRKTQTYSGGPLRVKIGPEGSDVDYDTGLARVRQKRDAAGQVLDQNVQMKEQDKQPAPPKVRRLADISDEEIRQWLTPDPVPAAPDKKPALPAAPDKKTAPVREADVTPAQFPRRGLNRQQRQAPQLPAEFHPKKISVLKNRTDPQHPAKKYYVGDSREHNGRPVQEQQAAQGQDSSALEQNRAIVQSLANPAAQARMQQHAADMDQMLSQPGYDHNPNAKQELAASRQRQRQQWINAVKNVHRWDDPLGVIRIALNKGISVDEVLQNLPAGINLSTLREQRTTEDMISTVRRGIDHYLRDLEQKLDPDRGLVDKAKDAIRHDDLDKLLPVKTVRTHDGHAIKIVGNERDGFQVRIREQPVQAQFHSLAEAEMACDMYCNRRKRSERERLSQDYVEENE